MPNAAIALGNVESGDVVTATNVSNYAINVGTNKQYTINNIQLAGQDNGNYYIAPSSSFLAELFPPERNLNSKNVTKVYDGKSSYSANVDDLAFLTNQLGIYGDKVTGATLSSDKNVSDNKNIQLSSVVISDDNSGNNYSLNSTVATGAALQYFRLLLGLVVILVTGLILPVGGWCGSGLIKCSKRYCS